MSNKKIKAPFQSVDPRCCYCNILTPFQSVETMLNGNTGTNDGIGNMYIEIAPPTHCSEPNKIFKVR